MKIPNITVITAGWRLEGVKNVIKILERQTFRNFDHIIVNDNSQDIRDWFVENNYFKDTKIHVVDNFTRCHSYGGVSRNIGISMAFSYFRERDRDLDNEYICFMDDDNEWKDNHLQSFVDILKEHNDATLIGSDMEIFGANDKNWREIKECKIEQDCCDLGSFLYLAKVFRKYGMFWPRPSKKHKFDFELINKIYQGEKDNTYFTNQTTFLLSYRKK